MLLIEKVSHCKKLAMHAVTIDRGSVAVFPDKCVLCGRSAPGHTMPLKAAYTERLAGIFQVIGGEWSTDIPCCAPYGRKRQGHQRRRFLFVLACISIGCLVAAIVISGAVGWWRIYAGVGIILAGLLPWWAFERLWRRPLSLSINGNAVTFIFKDSAYAVDFAKLNEIAAKSEEVIE